MQRIEEDLELKTCIKDIVDFLYEYDSIMHSVSLKLVEQQLIHLNELNYDKKKDDFFLSVNNAFVKMRDSGDYIVLYKNILTIILEKNLSLNVFVYEIIKNFLEDYVSENKQILNNYFIGKTQIKFSNKSSQSLLMKNPHWYVNINRPWVNLL